MAGVKMIVLYPTPTDLDAFERDYTNDHVPLARKINGMTKFVASKVLGAPGGAKPPFVRVAELYFPSMEALQQSATNPDTDTEMTMVIANCL